MTAGNTISPPPRRKIRLPDDFFQFTGRTTIWKAGWNQFLDNPLLGSGFNADRLLLNVHMHNSVLHAMVQTGMLGTIPFVAAILLGWFLLFQSVRQLNLLPPVHKHLVIQTGGVLAFLTIRSLMESTGAFFGIDWLLLAPLLLYLQVVNQSYGRRARAA